MAFYAYKCVNEKCESYEKEVDISKPMSESSREEFCEDCKEILQRIFSLAGHQTFGDGYKG